MATYLKRTSKLFDASLSQASTEMNLRDVICPVCRGILIEPVTLPCTHNLCLRCLNGTFEHNSLSCPLCRVRVGSWLRSATKSETLINSELWDLIRSHFPKEIESKHNDRENEIAADAGCPSRIISAAGEIRREYEIQLQIAEEEMRIQHKAEIMANEALIRKLQEEEREKLAQYAQDQLLAKTLAKKQILTKEKNSTLYNNFSNSRMSSNEVQILPLGSGASIEENGPLCHAKKGRTDISNMDANSCDFGKPSQMSENFVLDLKLATNRKECCQGPISVHNVLTLKHQSVLLIQKANYHYSQPSCSNSIYGTRSEEELHVPSDVLSSSKSLGVEFSISTIKNDDGRIGSAESAGSHDSINQEIHHFKPIKAMPRTPSRFLQDGRQIDHKLIRVVPIFESVSNVSPKPPAPSKRIIGCSWSAFRGKIQQNPRSDCTADLKVPSSSAQSYQTSKLSKPETVRKIDLTQETSFVKNKNYTKGRNLILNGTKLSKKLILDNNTEFTADKTWKTNMKNGLAERTKKYNSPNKKKDLSADDNSSTSFIQVSLKMPSTDDNGAAIENIAERIKKRKVAQSQTIDGIVEKIPRKTRSRTVASTKDETNPSSKAARRTVSKLKHLEVQSNNETQIIKSRNVEDVEMRIVKASKKSSRLRSEECIDASNDRIADEGNNNLDNVAIQEQEKMERLLRQEKDDYQLAQRLQAQFNELESISCRTRGSKRAFESCEIERRINKIKISDKLLVKHGNTSNTSSRMTKSRQRQMQD